MVLFAVVVTVAGVAPAVAGSPSAGSVYQISGMDVPSSVTTNESFRVSAQLSNDGAIDMQVVAFRIDTNGDGEFTPNESLGAEAFVLHEGASRNVTFDVSAADIEPGEYEYMLWTESSSMTGNITVESPVAPATFRLVGASGPDQITIGESFTVNARLANLGDLKGTENVSLYLDTDGDGLLSDEVALTSTSYDLNGSSEMTVGLNASTPEVSPGTYAIGVTTGAEVVAGEVNITQAPAPFEVRSLRTGRAMVDGTLGVSTIIKNADDEERTGIIEVRLDSNGDGRYTPEETVRTREVTLGAGASQLHNFAVDLPRGYDPGTYEFALVTPATVRTATFEVFRPSSGSDDDESPERTEEPPETTREDVAQALYGESYEALDDGQKLAVEDVFVRLPAEVPLSEIQTRQQLSQELYGEDFLVDDEFDNDGSEYALTPEQATTVQNTYDKQFGPLPESPDYSLEEVAVGLYGTSLENLKAYDLYQVYAVYNRQPYTEGYRFDQYSLGDESDTKVIRTQRRIANINYEPSIYVREWQTLDSESGLSLERLLEVYDAWQDQFEEN
ncbi:hypothetical protein N0B31_11040 [Salinirubellus salinus]|uniref:CARDB domain-containing protein n=1 Tax=Salinirubellus salinus TaxID=1364945 RepID=A0A9E7R6H4_9EURY|nr:hypothetical protein [Salinirubellus salinus]UWM56810.1 hypothetical protein N0B31_11040 [Salinirubellus salinus]